MLGALIFGSYGLVRGWAVWLHFTGVWQHAAVDDPALWLMRLYPNVRIWTASVLVMTGITIVILICL